MTKPLSGIRVIDLSQYAPGPYTTKLLCDLGAEVLKIEPPNGDPLRRMFCANDEQLSPVYHALNKGKTIARVDLKDPAAQQRTLDQVALADVFIESFRPGVVDKLGLDYTKCKQHNPGLIYASLSGYGQEGPYKNKAGHDINYAAAAGLLSTVTTPTPFFPLIADHTGAMNAVNAILAALLAKHRSGKGCCLDLSLYEAMLGWQYFNQSIADDQKKSLRLLTGGAACYQIYRTSDDRCITLGALEPHFWRNLCTAIGQPQWVERQFEPMPQTELIHAVSERFSSSTLSHWKAQLDSVDCCFEPIPLENEIYQHPQTQSRALFNHCEHAFPGKQDGEKISCGTDLAELSAGQLPDWQKLSQ